MKVGAVRFTNIIDSKRT